MRTVIQTIFLLFIVTSFLDRTLQQGMFLDGVIYAAISRNLAMGQGGIWSPQFQSLWFEHPPGFFWLESVFFQIFGDHYWVEKLFSGIVWILSLFMVAHVAKNLSGNKSSKSDIQWHTLLLWAIMPVVLWAYPNNLLDNLLALLCMGAVVDFHKGMTRNNLLYFISGAGLVGYAFLVKGPVALFPLALPVVYVLILDKHKLSIGLKGLLISFMILLLIGIIVWGNEAARTFVMKYWDQQVISSLSGNREKVNSAVGRFQILLYLLIQVLPAIGLIGILWIVMKFKKPIEATKWNTDKKNILYITLIGFSASLPLIISIKQREFYLLPALPFFALALAMFSQDLYNKIVSIQFSSRFLRDFRILSLLAGMALSFYLFIQIGKYGRDGDLLYDFNILKNTIQAETKVDVCPEMNTEWGIQALAQRILRTRMDFTGQNKVFLLDKNNCTETFRKGLADTGFLKDSVKTYRLEIWRKTQ